MVFLLSTIIYSGIYISLQDKIRFHDLLPCEQYSWTTLFSIHFSRSYGLLTFIDSLTQCHTEWWPIIFLLFIIQIFMCCDKFKIHDIWKIFIIILYYLLDCCLLKNFCVFVALQVFLTKHYRNRRVNDTEFVLDFEEIYVIDSKSKSITRAKVLVRCFLLHWLSVLCVGTRTMGFTPLL